VVRPAGTANKPDPAATVNGPPRRSDALAAGRDARPLFDNMTGPARPSFRRLTGLAGWTRRQDRG
jgi:hypothetical protein